jgi:large subunit ribosomal protein L6
MSRVAKRIIDLPAGVSVSVAGSAVTVKGARGALTVVLGAGVSIVQQEKQLSVKYEGDDKVRMRAGATRANLANMVQGVTRGYERKLELVGVGFRAQVAGKALNLAIPEGISIETPSQTEIVIKGNDRQRVGQTAAEIRGIRPPEPYKGKGVRYSDEQIILKEGKKK